MNDTPRIVSLGALADPLTKQLDGLIQPDALKHLDLDAEAITRLAVRSLLTDTEAHRARERLMKKIKEEARKHAEALNGSNNEVCRGSAAKNESP